MKEWIWFFMIILITVIAIAIMVYLWSTSSPASSYLWVLGGWFVLLVLIIVMWYALSPATTPLTTRQMPTQQSTYISTPTPTQTLTQMPMDPPGDTINHIHIHPQPAPQNIVNHNYSHSLHEIGEDPTVLVPQSPIYSQTIPQNVSTSKSTYVTGNKIPVNETIQVIPGNTRFDENPKTRITMTPDRIMPNTNVYHSDLGNTTGTLIQEGNTIIRRTDTGPHPVNLVRGSTPVVRRYRQ